jgi:AraC-like DNA-binding protein
LELAPEVALIVIAKTMCFSDVSDGLLSREFTRAMSTTPGAYRKRYSGD